MSAVEFLQLKQQLSRLSEKERQEAPPSFTGLNRKAQHGKRK
jgi:hypothetical protein